MDVAGKMFAKNALLPLTAKLMGKLAVALAASLTMMPVWYTPWPPICELEIAPVLEFKDIPSGKGG